MIGIASNMVTAFVPFPVGIFGGKRVAVTPDGQHAYITGFTCSGNYSPTVSVIDTGTNTVVGTITAGVGPSGVAPLYLSIASWREACEVKDASQPGPPQGHRARV